MKRFIVILGILILSLTAITANAFEYGYTSTGFKYVKHKHSESSYQHAWCGQHKGIEEFENKDFTRVDCLTDKYAVEFDFANKWAECIGQALYYSQRTGRTPACVLIMENPEKDIKYLKRLRYTVYNRKKIPAFRTFTIKPEHLYTNLEINNQ